LPEESKDVKEESEKTEGEEEKAEEIKDGMLAESSTGSDKSTEDTDYAKKG